MDQLQCVMDARDAYEAATLHVATRLNKVLVELSLAPPVPINATAKRMLFRDAEHNLKFDLEALRLFVPEFTAVHRFPLWAVGPMKVNFGDDLESKCRLLETQAKGCSREWVVDLFTVIVDEWRNTFCELENRFRGDLTVLEGKILAHLGDEQLTGERIAKRVGKDCDGHFKATLSGLMKRGLLKNSRPKGYFNPSKRESPKSGQSQD